MATRYLAVISIDVWAEDDLDAAQQAFELIRGASGPVVHVRPDDSCAPWQAVDLEDGEICQEQPAFLS